VSYTISFFIIYVVFFRWSQSALRRQIINLSWLWLKICIPAYFLNASPRPHQRNRLCLFFFVVFYLKYFCCNSLLIIIKLGNIVKKICFFCLMC